MDYTYPYIRPAMRETLDGYRLHHRSVGGFIQAVIANDLERAVTIADAENRDPDAMRDFVWYVHNELPGPAHDYRAWTTCMCAESLPPGAMIVVGPDDKYQGKNPNCLVHTWTPER